ncbi:dimethylarginine dimethylaminohydrolase family protein [Micromonospora orduensis]|uniref:dimethylarginine dimethylaminohydrolase family protein n=1 Tax=Micromonospora orduensis TaxID=1420891 RepID=UPI003810C1C1
MTNDTFIDAAGAPGGTLVNAVDDGRFGVRSMIAPLRRVLVRRPSTTGDFATAEWERPDPELLVRQHEDFCGLLASLGCEVELADTAEGMVDATFMKDPGLVIGRGAVVFQMSKPVRRGESVLFAEALKAAGVPITAELTGAARAEGGDILWLDAANVLVGRGYRTNTEGVRRLREIFRDEGVSVRSVDMPHDRGPLHVLHLTSIVSPVTEDLAVVYLPLAPVPLLEELEARGVRVIPVPPDEYETMACNVLTIRPGVVVMVAGNPRTQAALEAAGCEVHVYEGSEISVKGTGGPTCLTGPIWRG